MLGKSLSVARASCSGSGVPEEGDGIEVHAGGGEDKSTTSDSVHVDGALTNSLGCTISLRVGPRQHAVALLSAGSVEDTFLRHWPSAGVASRSPCVARGPCGRPAFGSGLSVSPTGFAAVSGISHFGWSCCEVGWGQPGYLRAVGSRFFFLAIVLVSPKISHSCQDACQVQARRGAVLHAYISHYTRWIRYG